jgi:hypothetical protein
MDTKKTILAIIASGFVYLIASEAFGLITQAIMPFDWTSVGGMRSFDDPIMILFFLYGFVSAIGAVVLYQFINLKGNTNQKGAKFGAMMWLATSVPSAFVILTTMTYPAGFFLNELVFGFFIWVLMGITIAFVLR